MKTLLLSLAVLLLAAGQAGAADDPNAVIDPNLVLCYRFDEPNGFVAHDSSGYGRHGDVNGPEEGWDPNDGRGGCRIFDGNTVVAVPNDVLSGISDGITVSLWLKGIFSQASDSWVFDTGFGGEDGPYRMQVTLVEGTVVPVQMLWRAGNDSSDVLLWDGYHPRYCWLGEWAFFVFVKDENEDELRLYVNCCLVASKSGVDNTLVNVRNAPFKIGAATWDASNLTAKMDDFMALDRALPESEIMAGWPCNTFDPGRAWGPSPPDAEVDVPYDANLAWRPGDYALEHRVFFGKTSEDVNCMTEPCAVKPLGQESYDPGPLDLDTTYYWRIDEVNGPNTWRGNIWQFTTARYIVVDDMESYTVGDPNQIWKTWRDGFDNHSCSYIALAFDPVHGGGQSMWYQYQNNNPWCIGYSVIDANTTGAQPGNLAVGRDWTKGGVRLLTLFFYGRPDNDAELMWVGLEDGSYDFAMVDYGDHGEDPNDIRQDEWHEWNIPLSEFADGGVELTDVGKVYIGFGDRMNPEAGGSGIVYFDDIRLELPRCVCPGPHADLNDDCVVDYGDLKIMAQEWLTAGIKADLIDDNNVDGRDYAVWAREWLEDTMWPQQ